jgi:outer membrane murein-binding lipoprotein Lpp
MDLTTEKNLTNINTADLESLTHVPGIGPALAERIIAARPFARLEDLGRVSGISPQSLLKLLPYLTINDIPLNPLPEFESQPGMGAEDANSSDPPKVSEDALITGPENKSKQSDNNAVSDEPGEVLPQVESVLDHTENLHVATTAKTSEPPISTTGVAEIPATPIPPTENRIAVENLTRSELIRLIMISNLLTLILTVFITLGVLFNINRGSLQFALPADINQLTQQASDLELKASTLEGDQAALRMRLNNMESMAGRLDELETVSTETRSLVDSNTAQVQTLATQAITLTLQINTVSGQVETLSSQVDELQTSSERYQKFFDGLAVLLANLFPEDK